MLSSVSAKARRADLPGNPAQCDAYLVQSDDALQVWDAQDHRWLNGVSIHGPQGPQSNRGTGWCTGSGAPSNLRSSIPGDLYLDKSSGDVYVLS